MLIRIQRLGLLVGIAIICLAQTALDNSAVIKVVKAGLGEDVVISMIQTQPGLYAKASDDLIALKAAGVSDKIIAAMIAKMTGNTPSSPSSTQEASRALEPQFPGVVYWFDHPNDKLTSLERAQTQRAAKMKVGGFGGAKATIEINGERSPIRFARDSKPNFVVRAVQNVDPLSRFAIVKLIVKKGIERL